MSFALAHLGKTNKAVDRKTSTPTKHLSSSPNHHRANNLNGKSPDYIFHLQRAIGNQAVQRLMRSNAAGFDFEKIGILQPQLKVSHPNDPYEQEANRVAEQVMRMSPTTPTSYPPFMVQDSITNDMDEEKVGRKCSSCSKMKEKRERKEEEEKTIMMNISRKTSTSSNLGVNDDIASEIHNVRSSAGLPLDANIKDFMESRFSYDFGDVRIHTDRQAAESTREVDALAFTVGRDIVFAASQYAPETTAGKRLIAHELTHVVQQSKESVTTPSVQRFWDEEEDKEEGTLDWLSGQVEAAVDWIGESGRDVTDWASEAGAQAIDWVADTGTDVVDWASGSEGMLAAGFAMSESYHPEEQAAEDASKDPTIGCEGILLHIESLIEELAGRLADLNEHNGGDKGHRERFQAVQEILKALMARAAIECKNGEYEEWKEVAENWANKPLPFVSTEPELSTEPGLREKIAEALEKAGIPAWAMSAMIVLIIAALADPEPFSKVVAIVGVAAAILIFGIIGRQSDVPSDVEAATPISESGTVA